LRFLAAVAIPEGGRADPGRAIPNKSSRAGQTLERDMLKDLFESKPRLFDLTRYSSRGDLFNAN
jgi:hypothetical protein